MQISTSRSPRRVPAPASEPGSADRPALAGADQPDAPEKPTYRTGPGWVECSDGRVWVDPGSGAGMWRRGYYDDAAGRVVFTGHPAYC